MLFPNISESNKAFAATPGNSTIFLDPSFSIQFSLGDATQTEEELESGIVGYISNNFTVNTKSAESYSIYLSPDTAAGYSNKLIGEKHKQEIDGVGSNISVNNFSNNTWGYGLTNPNEVNVANNTLTYSTIPDGSAPIKTVRNPDDGNDVYKLVFAARINDSKPADHYQSQAVLSVLASPQKIALAEVYKWSELMYMQQMTGYACNDAPISTTADDHQKQLIDVRDGKTYWVARLEDGNCWMTQNLDLDLSTSKALTPADSNVASNWTPPEDTQTSEKPNFTSTYGAVQSWDPGYNYFANGTAQTPANEALAKDTTGQIDAHYMQGNYYTWVAAMAGNTTGNTNESSICPKGWQLPLSNNDTNAKTFQALTNALGATSGTNTGSSDAKLLSNPGYFIHSGYIITTWLSYAGSRGYYLSASSGNGTAYHLYFKNDVVNSSDSIANYYGMSVRCVAK